MVLDESDGVVGALLAERALQQPAQVEGRTPARRIVKALLQRHVEEGHLPVATLQVVVEASDVVRPELTHCEEVAVRVPHSTQVVPGEGRAHVLDGIQSRSVEPQRPQHPVADAL